MPCRYVNNCAGFNCSPTARACQCACGELDPDSPECTCPDADACAEPRTLTAECECVCPGEPCPEGKNHDAECNCVCAEACPEGKTHDEECNCICSNECPEGKTFDENCNCVCPDEPCPGNQVRVQQNCNCVCPPETILVDGNCVQPGGYDCINNQCVGKEEPGATLEECGQNCSCFPPPLPPPGQPLLCADGTQYGLTSYTFNPATCTWTPVELIFNTCPDGGGSSSGQPNNTSSSSSGCDCAGAVGDASADELGFVCGFVVPLRRGSGFSDPTAGCVATYTVYEWCATCTQDGPALKSVQPFYYDSQACAFRELPKVEVPCPPESPSNTSSGSSDTSSGSSDTSSKSSDQSSSGSSNQSSSDSSSSDPSSSDSSSSGSSNQSSSDSSSSDPSSSDSSSSGSSNQSSSDSSSSDPSSSDSSSSGSSNQSSSSASSDQSSSDSSDESSSDSSSSSCSAEPNQIGFAVNSNGQFLNSFGPGDTATLSVLVADNAAGERSRINWDFNANGLSVLNFDVKENDPNPQTFTLSTETLLAIYGLTTETAPECEYVFDFCGTAIDCAGNVDEECNGQIIVNLCNGSSGSRTVSSGQSSGSNQSSTSNQQSSSSSDQLFSSNQSSTSSQQSSSSSQQSSSSNDQSSGRQQSSSSSDQSSSSNQSSTNSQQSSSSSQQSSVSGQQSSASGGTPPTDECGCGQMCPVSIDLCDSVFHWSL